MSSRVQSRRIRRDSIEPAVFEVLWRRWKADDRDLLDGGVSRTTIASEITAYESSVRAVLRRLEERGVVVRLRGLSPETRTPRDSWAPAALFDGPGGERQ